MTASGNGDGSDENDSEIATTLARAEAPEAQDDADKAQFAETIERQPDASPIHDPRYQRRKPLGSGGMGEVHLCTDTKLDRDVAVKIVRREKDVDGQLVARFLHEARVQGQLAHPAVVPVYDIDESNPETPFFTMKRVKGHALNHIITDLRCGDASAQEHYSQRRLLSAFSNICLAVDFAHTRGVVHRDLKPSNIMLGDFGEVYVLDWGLAKVAGVPDINESQKLKVVDSGSGPETAVGSVLGTPGYMSPEQIRGEEVDGASDVYALGAILYELLTYTKMHKGNSRQDLVNATLIGDIEEPSKRAPARNIPPELEALCLKATQTAPGARPASARELSDAIEDFLDGDRDIKRRRQLADEHARNAEEAAARALDGGDSADALRRRAVEEANRAIALAPKHALASDVIMRLLSSPPEVMPPDVVEAMKARRLSTVHSSAKAAAWLFSTAFLYLPLAWWMGLKEPEKLLAWVLVCEAGALGITIYASRTRRVPGFGIFISCVLAACFGLGAVAMTVGPLIVMPQLLLANLLGFLLIALPGWRAITILVHAFALFLPYALQVAGIVEPWYRFEGGAMLVPERWLGLPEIPTIITLIVVTLVGAGTACYFTIRTRKELDDAHAQLTLYAWHYGAAPKVETETTRTSS